MRKFFISSVICLLLGLGGPVAAEREVHVVAVGKGQLPDDPYALPEAHVLVDRPGREVGLVLLDGDALRWRVEVTQGTFLTEIIRSGPGPRDSEVVLSGIPMAGVQRTGLPLVFHPWGRDFRILVDQLAAWMGAERLHSFQGAHKVGDIALRVDRIDTVTAGLARDYLSVQLRASGDLPAALGRWLETGNVERRYDVGFDTAGISLSGPAGTRRFPVSADVPAILLPVMGVYAPETQRLYGLTYGAEGYLYSADAQTGDWAVVVNLNGYDAAGLLYDAKSRQLITTGGFSRPGDIRAYGLDGSRVSTFVPTLEFPGLTDLFDFGNEHGPPLQPRVYADGWLLLEVLGDPAASYPKAGPYRIYALRIETGEVRLLRFRNG